MAASTCVGIDRDSAFQVVAALVKRTDSPVLSLSALCKHPAHPHLVDSGISNIPTIHLSILVESFACAADLSLHSESFQLGLRLALSSMLLPLVLICRTFYV